MNNLNINVINESFNTYPFKNFRLFKGIVLDDFDKPIENATITLNGKYAACDFILLGGTTSNKNGYFKFFLDISHLNFDIYKLSVFAPLSKLAIKTISF